MNNSPFSMGWLMAMFDLPVMTQEERKVASRFRNDLLDNGFLMIQFSVYARPCVNFEQLNKHIDGRAARRRTHETLALPPHSLLPTSALLAPFPPQDACRLTQAEPYCWHDERSRPGHAARPAVQAAPVAPDRPPRAGHGRRI